MQTLKERMINYRNQTEQILDKNQYIMIMLDGRSFSKLIKNEFKKPYDDDFIDMMNSITKYLLQNISDCKFAYCQSDEISIVMDLRKKEEGSAFFGLRITKLLSIIAAMASSKFQQLYLMYHLDNDLHDKNSNDIKTYINNIKLFQFDCKVWNLPNMDEVYNWFLYRQNDCIRNSVFQLAHCYLPKTEFFKKNTTELIVLLKGNNIDWNNIDDDKKYGRFFFQVEKEIKSMDEKIIKRKKWEKINAFKLSKNNKEIIFEKLN